MFFIESSLNFYMAAAASALCTEILQFDLFISGRNISCIANSGRKFKRALRLCRIKITIFDDKWSENVLRAIRKGNVTEQSEVGEEILYEMATQVFTVRRSVPLHLSIIFM